MSIKPVDFQVMLPRTTQVAKIHNDDQNKSQALHQQQANTVQHKAEENVRLVHSQDEAHETGIREKEEKKQKNKEQEEEKEKKRKKGNYNSNRKSEEIKISTIDIKI